MEGVTHVESSLLIEQSPDAVIFADRDGTIQTWNAAAERIFGFPPEAAVGQNLDIIIPERFRQAHWTGFERAMGEAKTKYVGQSLPTRALRADGTQFYVELGFAIVVADGKAVGALATARDITERFEKERADRARLKELEAKVADQG